MSKNIMLVDNSTSALESLKWMLKDGPYYLFSFDNPLKALSALDAIEFAVVLVDQWVSEIDSIEFLKTVKKKSPETVGIIMTGYMEFEKRTGALDKSSAYLFVKKPLIGVGIKQAVESAIAHYEMNSEMKKLLFLTSG